MARAEEITQAELRRLAGRYNRGLSIRAIAKESGRSYGFTYARLRVAAGQGLVAIRPRGSRSSLTQAR